MDTYTLFRWALSVLFGLLGCWIMLMNFTMVYMWYARRKHSSQIPLVGGGLAFLGLSVCPLPQVQKLAWIPLAVDIGYLVATLTFGFASMLLRRLFKGKKDDSEPRI
ncbi:MAG: hypothetical protein JWQ71_4210 [Pedosphaera sp.]|nr:hypothetical protein [Pedosphaera sp.]